VTDLQAAREIYVAGEMIDQPLFLGLVANEEGGGRERLSRRR